jgi:hypothetical protein
MTFEVPRLDDRGLRKFGLTTGLIIVVLFAIFFPWVFEAKSIPLWPWIIAALLWGPALLRPGLLKHVYLIWMKIGHGLGWVNTRIILSLVFYAVVLPLGLLMRLFGKDPMATRHDKSAISYRITSVREPKERLEKPY